MQSWSESVGDSHWRRQRLFDALNRTFRAITAPTVLLVDDLQWCDGETVTWLHYFLQESQQIDDVGRAALPLLIVGTARPEIQQEAHHLQPMLTHLRSRALITEIDLEPLGADATATLAAHIAASDLTETESMELYRYTEGNPLFIIESVRTKAWRTSSNTVQAGEQNDSQQALSMTADGKQPVSSASHATQNASGDPRAPGPVVTTGTAIGWSRRPDWPIL